jgi:hypothetical protein
MLRAVAGEVYYYVRATFKQPNIESLAIRKPKADHDC